jgi:hypothetical protein
MSNAITIPDHQSQAAAMIQMAVDKGMPAEQLREFIAARREWENDEARKLYSQAIADFQSRCPIIEKADKAHNKQYAAMDRIWRTIRPLLDETGLSVVWTANTLTEYGLRIEGEIRHKAGHAVPISYDLPMPDKVTGQNAAQQMGSATTYAKRYALCSALGIVTGEDDDGLAAGTSYVTKEHADELVAILDTLSDRDGALAAMLEYAECDSVSDIPADKFAKCRKGLLTKPKK